MLGPMRRALLLLAPLPIVLGCGGPAPVDGIIGGGGVTALFDTSPARADFFALPWPSDDRIAPGSDGALHLALAGYHDPGGAIGGYLSLFHSEPATGFGTSAPVFF